MDFLGNISKIVASVVATVTTMASSIVPGINQPLITPPPVNNPETVIQQNMVVRSGVITYSEQSVKYIINIPKNGGDVTGSVSGICNGSITGTYDGGEGGNISGTANPSCGVAFIRQTFNISYNGQLYLKQGKADLNWEGDIPSTPGKGSYTFNFEPEK